MNPYRINLVYETKCLQLRLVTMEDAPDLLKCYSDPQAVEKMNSDLCTSDFYMTTLEQMGDCIHFWLQEYEKQAYVRLSVIPKTLGQAVGTVELFGCDSPEFGHTGILRMDLASEYEIPQIISELTALAIGSFMKDFDMERLYIKAGHTPERAEVLCEYGFAPTDEFRTGLGYYVYAKKTIAYCGLACCVCSENKSCSGCQAGGCETHGDCKNYHCCREKKLNGCWECSEFPCEGTMLDQPRIRGFAQFVKEYGTDELVRCLMKNKASGICYHDDGKLKGDYDIFETKEELFSMISGS